MSAPRFVYTSIVFPACFVAELAAVSCDQRRSYTMVQRHDNEDRVNVDPGNEGAPP